jgi:hypothetical protein
MNILYNAFPDLAASILDWWETLALGAMWPGMFINFLFTYGKGRLYRLGYLCLLASVATLFYVDVLTPADSIVNNDDILRPIFYTALAYTVWQRAILFLQYLKMRREQLVLSIQQVSSLENTVIDFKEVLRFSDRLERWRSFLITVVAIVFAIGVLYSNVDRIEQKQTDTIVSSDRQTRTQQDTQRELLAIKEKQDSTALAQNLALQEQTRWIISQLNNFKVQDSANAEANRRQLANQRRALLYLQTMEKNIRANMNPVDKIPPKPSATFELDPDKVKSTVPQGRKRTADASEVSSGDTLYAKWYEREGY